MAFQNVDQEILEEFAELQLIMVRPKLSPRRDGQQERDPMGSLSYMKSSQSLGGKAGVAMLRAGRKARGECLHCGKPDAGASRCSVCVERRKGWERAKPLRRAEAIFQRERNHLHRQALRLLSKTKDWRSRMKLLQEMNRAGLDAPPEMSVQILCAKLKEKSRAWAGCLVRGLKHV